MEYFAVTTWIWVVEYFRRHFQRDAVKRRLRPRLLAGSMGIACMTLLLYIHKRIFDRLGARGPGFGAPRLPRSLGQNRRDRQSQRCLWVPDTLLTKLLTKRVQGRWMKRVSALFCMVSAVGIEP